MITPANLQTNKQKKATFCNIRTNRKLKIGVINIYGNDEIQFCDCNLEPL